MQATGLKNDQDKLPYNLLDRTALDEVARVLEFGAQKYSAENWRGGIQYSRLIGATLRHMMAVSDGEDFDPETGLPHAAHAMCSMMFLLWHMKYRPDLDDRWNGAGAALAQPTADVSVDPAIDAMEADIRAMAAKLSPEFVERA
ncbi:hypothetical protein UFOVP55_48 [uncultured Caudovirales phage]|uniref:dATP/dGTP diphosphohydrolase N-terminal domain-containing protein n=1 Tax=uncultured Caudovirales phage TaxID=2100421 RepID=A0A6J5KRA3_9CAUD|nr:hypothetical protein UFOVP55_48 [uncultured Caudovirales phage]